MFFANNQTENQMLEEVAYSKLFEMWFNIWGGQRYLYKNKKYEKKMKKSEGQN